MADRQTQLPLQMCGSFRCDNREPATHYTVARSASTGERFVLFYCERHKGPSCKPIPAGEDSDG